MKKISAVALAAGLLCALPVTGWANALYRCTDEAGRTAYVDAKNRGGYKSCRPLEGTISVVPAQKPATAASPTGFPKVDGNTQKKRDESRRKILEQELANEQRLLGEARQELAQAESVREGPEARNYQKYLDRVQPFKDTVSLHEKNIEALQKELSNLR
jgi:hypothetical protein